MRRLLPAALGLSVFAASCGGGAPRTESGVAASAASVSVTGQVAQKGTRGSIVVFAYGDSAAADDPSAHEPTSIAPLSPDGGFDLSIPPSPGLTIIFLADGSNDGVIDEGDPIAALTAPELTDLQAGDRVQISDATIDFHGHKVTATVDIARVGGLAHTPTPLP